jgi:hypothetical protein
LIGADNFIDGGGSAAAVRKNDAKYIKEREFLRLIYCEMEAMESCNKMFD